MLCPVSNQSPAEEQVNLVTHALGLAFSLIGLGALLVQGFRSGTGAFLVALIYGLSLVQLFAVSTLYHALGDLRTKRRARIADHCSIFVLIAGSYTPFMVLVLGDWRGWSLLLAVWSLAFFGIHFKCSSPRPFGVHSVLLYLVMGWAVLLVYAPLMSSLSVAAARCLVCGGAAYTLGIPFYAWQSLRHSHGIWHGFVLLGAFCHYLAVFTCL